VAAEKPECVPVADFTPTPSDVNFKALNPMPAGEQLLVGKWNNGLDTVTSMKPDGAEELTLFQVYRVWSMGVSRAVDKIAFSSGDPLQESHYCITLGDAVQHTWLYDIKTQEVELLSKGDVNDECHLFGPGDKSLYICRRYDFAFDGEFWTSKGYTVGRIGLQDKSFELLTHPQGNDMALHGVPSEDEAWLYFTLIKVPGFGRAVMRMPLGEAPDAAGAELVRDKASSMVMSPDGTQYVYSDSDDKSALYIANVDGSGTPIKLADTNGTDPAFSPDGKRLAYLIWDQSAVCSHIEIVATDGSEASTPTRIHDCKKSGDSPAELAWVVRP
jgi:hypothetical protein